ncbi:nucleoside deaminase [Mucilaginibacter auburnensis]|uniref:tRNA(Arg) A34 adenosine deaminase TadA n=1 Tax=Mucilaginibacter auburnensis TaxID=1457233 RepID=A0A2H9VP37_9SPHI|nr:nucleoside deaminase [Mucilaginibacter auburnensis]PJJ80060.1 tRNA(Arg) A34 adenosine deaminase TadA [Mucilaginibacter auburnensis]
MDHEKFMRIAIALSQHNVEKGLGGPFGAVVVKDGEIVAQSANRVVPDNDPTAHAEVAAIRLACKELNTFDLSGCYIYASCEPCPMCLGAIYWARIDKLFYANTKHDAANIGFDDEFIYQELALKMDDRKIDHEQLMRDEALAVFKLWDKDGNKQSY